MAERAAAQGIDVTLELYPQMIHVWHFLFPLLADAREAIESAGRFIRRHVPYRQNAGTFIDDPLTA
jgi:acetyl esterase/lipase